MKVTVTIEVPDAFIADQYANAEFDKASGMTPISFPAHSAIRSLIEESNIRICVKAVTIEEADKKTTAVDYIQDVQGDR